MNAMHWQCRVHSPAWQFVGPDYIDPNRTYFRKDVWQTRIFEDRLVGELSNVDQFEQVSLHLANLLRNVRIEREDLMKESWSHNIVCSTAFSGRIFKREENGCPAAHVAENCTIGKCLYGSCFFNSALEQHVDLIYTVLFSSREIV